MGKDLERPLVVVSAVNLAEGGPLEVLRQFLVHLRAAAPAHWRILALVHDEALVADTGVEARAFPEARQSWLKRLRLEWFGFRGLDLGSRPAAWVSLHDITPRVRADMQFVYCHNPSPFYRPSIWEARLEPTLFVFSLLYRYVYRLRIGRNRAVIVQQEWLRERFEQDFGCERVWVARPSVVQTPSPVAARTSDVAADRPFRFLFPALPRVFKNHHVIVDACALLKSRDLPPFEVLFTLSGRENRYAEKILQRANGLSAIRWLGRLSRDEMSRAYEDADVVLFPSKLETWGLPITEAKAFGKGLLLADLPYARETLGDYDRAAFFRPDDAKALADLMEACVRGSITYRPTTALGRSDHLAEDWSDLADMLVGEIATGPRAPARAVDR